MSHALRHSLLLLVLLLILVGALALAGMLVRMHGPAGPAALTFRTSYPGTFRPLDPAHLALPIPPQDAMVEELPDGAQRCLYVFRVRTNDSLYNASVALFEQSNQVPPRLRAPAQMADNSALDLSLLTDEGFILQRSILIRGNLFAILLTGNSEITAPDVAVFRQVCAAVRVRPTREK